MTAPVVEQWRVADATPVCPAHLIVHILSDTTVVTACGWTPYGGLRIGRSDVVGRRFACGGCLRAARAKDRAKDRAAVDVFKTYGNGGRRS